MRAKLLLPVMLAAFTVGWRSPVPLVYPVNMTLSGERLFVSDRFNGIHIFDVTDPAAPKPTLTIPLNDNRGTAVRGDIVYANDESRLLVIRVTDDAYEVIKEIETSQPYVDGGPLWGDVIVERDNGFGCDCNNPYDAARVAAPASGTGSSYATFTVIDNYLYYLDYTSIVTMDISTPEDPKELSRTRIGWQIETLYPSKKLLFVGGSRGMYVFDRSNPAAPREIGGVEHFRACDPVVVSGPVAYVTLRGGNRCGQSRDVLLCVSLENPSAPVVLGEKELHTPYGLVARGPFLYVSNGTGGYKLLDVARPFEPQVVAGWSDWPTKDFIWDGDVLYVLGFDDLRVFDVGDPAKPVLLATLEPSAAQEVARE